MNNLYLADVKKYLSSLYPESKVYSGAIDTSNDTCLGIFKRNIGTPVIAIGGLNNSSYNILPVSILVHWTESTDDCEIKAEEIYNHFLDKTSFSMNNKNVYFSICESTGPIDLSRDERNICEMVVHVNFYYER